MNTVKKKKKTKKSKRTRRSLLIAKDGTTLRGPGEFIRLMSPGHLFTSMSSRPSPWERSSLLGPTRLVAGGEGGGKWCIHTMGSFPMGGCQSFNAPDRVNCSK